MEPEDVVHVLRRLRETLVPDGLVLDLQVIRPNPRVESGGETICEIDGWPLFRLADAAASAVDLLVAEGALVEEAVDEHEVVKHYDSGRILVDEWTDKERKLPPDAVRVIAAIPGTCLIRERCRTRRLRRGG